MYLYLKVEKGNLFIVTYNIYIWITDEAWGQDGCTLVSIWQDWEANIKLCWPSKDLQDIQDIFSLRDS